MEERSLRVVATDKTFFNKLTNTLTKFLIPTQIGFNSLKISMKRNVLIKTYETLNAENAPVEKKEELEKRYDDAYTAYLEALDKYVLDTIYKKVKNETATQFESTALSQYYGIVQLKDREYNEIIKNGTKVRQIITLHKNDINLKRFTTIDNIFMGNSDFISFDEIESLAKYYRKPINSQFGKQQDSIILYTSGTTGSPKAVLITNENIISSGIYMKNSIGEAMNKGKKCLVCVDFSYPYGSLTSALMTLMSKKEAILTPGLNAKNFYTFLQRKPNYIFGIPSICNIMLNDPEINKMDLSFLQVFISGGDFLSPKKSTELLEFLKRHGSNASICNGSGNAETTGANTNAVGIKYNPMSVGKPLVGTNVKIISPETGEELKYNEVGYICYSGKHVFKEYFNDKKTTSKVKKYDQKGVCWYITDTLGFIDEEGYAHIVGRDRDFIITFGETGSAYKIYCNMVQESIASINFIDSCVVVGVSDSTRDKVGYAFVKLKSGS